MRFKLSMLLLCALSPLVASCPSPSRQSPPPPKGRSHDAYLEQGRAPNAKEIIPRSDHRDDDRMVLHFIDVGQGAATLLEFPCGAILIDSGGEKNERFDSEPQLLAYLDAFFERRKDLRRTFDALVVSHPHIDHTRSLQTVVGRYRVRNLIDNGDVTDDLGGKPQLALHDWLYQQNQKRSQPVGHFEVASEGLTKQGVYNEVIDPIPACPKSDHDPKIRALWGMRLGRREKGHNANNDSVVLRVDYGEASALLSGDLERLSIAWMSKHYQDEMEILDTDIYYVPHHGSRNSTSAAWVKAISPRLAVISMGPYERHLDTWPEYTARSFGHPNRDSIGDLLAPGGVSAYRETPIKAMVGIRGRWEDTPSEFEEQVIDKAVYATGWDGHIKVGAYPDGRLEVLTSKPPRQ